MPNGTYFQSAPTAPQTTPASPPLSHASGTAKPSTTSSDLAGPNDAATKLAEAIDDFLGDLEKKFKGISDEILTKCECIFSLSGEEYALSWRAFSG